jgi:hypothetical protein
VVIKRVVDYRDGEATHHNGRVIGCIVLCGAGVDKDDEAMELFRGSSIDTSGALTPRTKEYMMSGEWDEKDKIIIKFILDENCQGRIGVTSAGPGGADRFCGKVQCVTATHRKSQVKVPSNHWFIQAGPLSAAGLLSFPRLPSMELCGPVPKLFEDHVSDVHRKQFSGLNMGQWRFLFEDRQTQNVNTKGSPLPSPDNPTGLDSSSSEGLSIVPLLPVSETADDAYLAVEPLATIPNIPVPLKFEEPDTEKENPSYIPTKENPEELLIKGILKSIQFLDEGTIYIQDSVQDLKLENDDLASKLAKAERNAEKCRYEIIRLRTKAKDLRVELQTVASETAQIKT